MPEIGPMMRALELQRLIEDKVAEWRERSARVAGATVADAYQQPLNFKRHTHRRKNNAEINRIIAKYSKPTKRADEPYSVRLTPDTSPKRPPRAKKLSKVLSKSEDNLTSIDEMEVETHPKQEAQPYFNLSKYNTKSCEDVTAFVDIHHNVKSKNFEQNSILNAKTVVPDRRPKLHSICEGVTDISEFSDSGLECDRSIDRSFATSTPLPKRKTCPPGGSVLTLNFEKVTKKPTSVSDLRKGVSEPNILSADASESGISKTIDFRKRWKMLKPPFKKGAFDCLLLWRGKKQTPTTDNNSRR